MEEQQDGLQGSQGRRGEERAGLAARREKAQTGEPEPRLKTRPKGTPCLAHFNLQGGKSARFLGFLGLASACACREEPSGAWQGRNTPVKIKSWLRPAGSWCSQGSRQDCAGAATGANRGAALGCWFIFAYVPVFCLVRSVTPWIWRDSILPNRTYQSTSSSLKYYYVLYSRSARLNSCHSFVLHHYILTPFQGLLGIAVVLAQHTAKVIYSLCTP